jgi:hypothetical protein
MQCRVTINNKLNTRNDLAGPWRAYRPSPVACQCLRILLHIRFVEVVTLNITMGLLNCNRYIYPASTLFILIMIAKIEWHIQGGFNKFQTLGNETKEKISVPSR